MLNELKDAIREKYLDFGFTDEQRKAVLILFAGALAVGAIFFALSQGRSGEPAAAVGSLAPEVSRG